MKNGSNKLSSFQIDCFLPLFSLLVNSAGFRQASKVGGNQADNFGQVLFAMSLLLTLDDSCSRLAAILLKSTRMNLFVALRVRQQHLSVSLRTISQEFDKFSEFMP